MWNFLSSLNIFDGFSSQDLENIAQQGKTKIFKKGDHIISQGAHDTYFYVLESGIVSVVRDNEVINTIFEWDIFWEISLLTSEVRTASIVAETDVKVVCFEKNMLFDMLKKYDTNNTIQKTIINRIIMNHKK